MHLPDPTFPPLLSGCAVMGAPGAYATARQKVADGTAGAGDVFWSTSVHRLDVAIVLEPEVETRRAVHMLFAALVAFGDSLGALGPPEMGLYYEWPGRILVNGAHVGQVRMALPSDATTESVPDWLVIGLDIRLKYDRRTVEPGEDEGNTALEEEGCGDLTRTDLVESYCRHFLVWINTWQHDGFRPIHEVWTGRMTGRTDRIDLEHAGRRHQGAFVGLEEDGNLLFRPDGSQEVRVLDIIDSVDRGATE